MNVSVISCQIPSKVKKYCMLWHDGRTSNMYRLATTGLFNPEKLLAEVEKRLILCSLESEQRELDVIKEYAEKQIQRDAVEIALYRAARKVVYSSSYSLEDAVEYFRLCFEEHKSNVY